METSDEWCPLEVCLGTNALQHPYQWMETVGSNAPSADLEITLNPSGTVGAIDGRDAIKRCGQA